MLQKILKEISSYMDTFMIIISIFLIFQITIISSIVLPPFSIFILHTLDYRNCTFEFFETNQTKKFKEKIFLTNGFKRGFLISVILCFFFWSPGILFSYFMWFRFFYLKIKK